MMDTSERGYCPFRVKKENFQAGCVLQLGKDTFCYSQDVRPLTKQKSYYICPLLNVTLSNKMYKEIEMVIAPILAVQDEETTAVNLWPLLSGISSSKHNSITFKGKKMQELSKKLKEELGEIVFNLT